MNENECNLQDLFRASVLGGTIAVSAATAYVLHSAADAPHTSLEQAAANASRKLPPIGAVAALTGAIAGGVIASRRRGGRDSAGSASWATPADVAELLVPRGGNLPSDGLVLGKLRGRQLALNRSRTLTHGLVIGPTGSGKSRSAFLPNLGRRRTDSFFAPDPQGELYDCTVRFHRRVRRYAPLEPAASVPFNWIPRCRDAVIAKMLGRALAMQRQGGEGKQSDFFWLEGESLILGALFAHVAETDDPTPRAALELVTTLDTDAFVKTLETSPSAAARCLIAGLRHGKDPKMRSGMLIGVVNALMFLADERVIEFTSSTREGADFRELRSWPVGVYWILPQADVAPLMGLTSIFFNLLLHDAKRGEGRTGVTLFIDEAGNVGKIPDLAKEITLLRDLGIAFVLGLQSFSQFNALYGREDARTITDNCLTWIVLAGLRPSTAEEVSKALGERTVFSESEGGSTSRAGGWFGKVSHSTSSNRSERARRLYTADEVRRLPANMAIVLHNNMRPVLVVREHSTLTRVSEDAEISAYRK